MGRKIPGIIIRSLWLYKKVSRGHYLVEFELVNENPATTAYGEITEAHTRMLERDILQEPEYWLWSHRRWKHKKPVELPVREL
jgi:KDO2-lipid IV(A) lauroyltransferase